VQQHAGNARRQAGEQHAADEAQGVALALDGVAGDAQEPPEVDDDDGEDGAELDQHLEHPAGTVETEEVFDKQQVPGRGDGQEFRQSLDDA
jgi:hypothetical protein